VIELLLPRRGGRPLTFSRRLVIDTVRYVLGPGTPGGRRRTARPLGVRPTAGFARRTGSMTYCATGYAPATGGLRSRRRPCRSRGAIRAMRPSATTRANACGADLLVDTCRLVLRGRWCTPPPSRNASGRNWSCPASGNGSHRSASCGGRRVRHLGTSVDAGPVGRAAEHENVATLAVPRDAKGFRTLPRQTGSHRGHLAGARPSAASKVPCRMGGSSSARCSRGPRWVSRGASGPRPSLRSGHGGRCR
jgi:hypothetical protein